MISRDGCPPQHLLPRFMTTELSFVTSVHDKLLSSHLNGTGEMQKTTVLKSASRNVTRCHLYTVAAAPAESPEARGEQTDATAEDQHSGGAAAPPPSGGSGRKQLRQSLSVPHWHHQVRFSYNLLSGVPTRLSGFFVM